MTFEWDENKNLENIEKHGVSFDEAKSAFEDSKRVVLPDEKHSLLEKRYYCISKIENGIITVRFTFRNGNIRIFGTAYWRKEEKIYKTTNNLL
jgi:uncharacterized DUF497 family protein